MTVLRYTRGDELEPVAITWYEPDGTLYDFTSGWTFRARIGNGAGFLVEKTTGFTGAATAPNLQLNFSAGELDGVGPGTYHLDIQATLTATTQTITRTWVFQILAGVGTDTLPQSPTSLGILGDLTVDGDLQLPVTTIEADGDVTSGVIRRTHSIQVPWDYTHNSTASPTDPAFGTAVLVDADVTLTGTGGTGFGAEFQTGYFGPRGVFQFEGLIRYAGNLSNLVLPAVGYGDFPSFANNAGSARTLSGSWGFLSARSYVADGATVTLDGTDVNNGGAAFVDSAVYATVDSGTLNGTTNSFEHVSYLSMPGIGGNTSITRRIGFDVMPAYEGMHPLIPEPTGAHWSGAGNWDPTTPTLSEEIGLRIQKFTLGTSKVGIDTAEKIKVLTADATNTSTDPIYAVEIANGHTFTLNDGSGGFRTGNNFVGVQLSPTVVYDQDGGAITAFNGWSSAPILKNAATEAHTIPLAQGVGIRHIYRGDGALLTVASHIGFEDALSPDVINSGTVSITAAIGYRSTAAIATGATVVTRTGFTAVDATGAGTVTTQIGIDVPTLAKATTNIGIRNASTEVDTPAAQTLSAAGNAITATAKVKALTNSTGGSLTLTSAPTIANGQDGQIVELVNVGAQDIVLQDQGTLASSNLRLVAASVTLTPRDTVRLRYNATVGDWVQASSVVNVL